MNEPKLVWYTAAQRENAERVAAREGGAHCGGKTCQASKQAVRGGKEGKPYPCLCPCPTCTRTRRSKEG